MLISILQNNVDTLSFIHKAILYKGRIHIDYRFWLGLSPGSSSETSPAAMSEEKRKFSQAMRVVIRVKYWLDKRLDLVDFHEHFSTRNSKRQKFHVGKGKCLRMSYEREM